MTDILRISEHSKLMNQIEISLELFPVAVMQRRELSCTSSRNMST